MLSIFFLSFFIGMRHALEADHIAAVATLSDTANTQSAIKLGLTWGLGHTITLFLFGGVVLWLDSTVPESLAQALEFSVGVMLLVLGVDVIRRLLRDKIHYHFHQHKYKQDDDGSPVLETHIHAHSHKGETQHQAVHQHQHIKGLSLRILFIGLMHGMAGSAALILLTLEMVKSPWQGLLYILLFGIGTMVGMAAVTVVISYPLRKASEKGMTWLHNGLQLVVGISTIGLGVLVMVHNY